MEKLIFRKFFKDTLSFFIIGILSLSLIVWVIQAVNYLDFVSEDGHSFKVYFLYTLLNFPKIFSRLLIFMFFISIFYTISKYEEKNELLIFWTSGIKKREFLNFIIKFSFLIMILHLVLNLFIVPKSQDLARSYIRSSNIDYFPSLLKSKKFISTVENLTIFIEEKKDNGELFNIFLKDTKKTSGVNNSSQIITANKGRLVKDENYYLILYDGHIVDNNKKGSNIISYDKTQINLSNYSTQTTVDPKIQEQSTNLLFNCMISVYKHNEFYKDRNLDCNKSTINIVNEEIYKRLIVPFYVLIVSVIAGSLIMRSENQNNFNFFKIAIFCFGVLFIILSQALSQYSGIINIKNMGVILFPFLTSFIFFILLQYKLNK